MSFIQNVFSAIRFARLPNTTGLFLTTDALGILGLAPIPAAPDPIPVPFDWTVGPTTFIDMTPPEMAALGANPRIEVWLTLDEDTQQRYDEPGECLKHLIGGVLQSIEFPALDLEFAASQTGYFLIAK